MGSNRHLILCPTFLGLFLLVNTPALSEEATCPSLNPVPPSVLLLAPPCDECQETTAELGELQMLQTSRTPDEAKHAKGDHERTIDRFLGEVGISMPDPLPLTRHLFACIAEVAENAIRGAKATFHRTRPYKLPSNELKVLKKAGDTDSFSYPSGHATYGTVVGLVLAEMIPEEKERIVQRIRDYGFSRMVAGVHFRSDVYAGQFAGAAIAASLFADVNFRSEFEIAKAELRKTLGY